MAQSKTPVIIVGAGPVGLALALGLAHYGVGSVVLEKKTELSPYSRALLISTRTLEIWRAWGLYDTFVAKSPLIQRMAVWVVGEDTPRAAINLGRLAGASAIAGAIIMPQNCTEELLLQAARAHPLIEVRFDNEVTGFVAGGESVTVSLKDAPSLEGEFLVGCDGAHSVVRAGLGWELEGKTYPVRMLLADITLNDSRGNLPWPRVCAMNDGGALAGIRFANGQWRVLATMSNKQTEEAALSQQSLDAKVLALFGQGPYQRNWASTFHLHCRCSRRFVQGRVVLAGDAAHLNSPAGGQGMNAGIGDAHNLAWKLVRSLQGGDVDRLLTSYEQERRSAFTGSVEPVTDFLTRMVLTPPPWLRSVLLRLACLLVRLPAVQMQFALRAGMLTTTYPQSALLELGPEGVGARLADGEIVDISGGKGRALDLVNDGAALVLCDDGGLPGWDDVEITRQLGHLRGLRLVRLLAPDAPPPLQPSAAHTEVFRSSRRLWNRWQATGDLALLIRPDGYLGFRARRPTPLLLCRGVRVALGLLPARPVPQPAAELGDAKAAPVAEGDAPG